MRIAFGTLGCRLNQFETDSLVSRFRSNNYDIVSFDEFADAYIINTCTVTNKSDAKSRRMILKARRNNPDAVVVVAGCWVNTDEQKIRNIDGVTYLINNENKSKIYELIHNHFYNVKTDLSQGNPFDYQPAYNTLHTRSYLKIQEGCNYFCSYCKIPYARGNPISRKSTDVIEHFKKLLDFGYKEVILTGVNIAEYYDGNVDFVKLVEKLLMIESDFRIHISSIEPNKVNHDLVSLFSSSKLVQHLHIPLQSGSDKILKLMNRKYSTSDFANKIEMIHNLHSELNLTTDLIVGFPSESDDDFDESVKMIKDAKFSHVHTFKYSIRNGTKAARMKGQIGPDVKTKRSKVIRDLSAEQSREYNQRFLNTIKRTIVEKTVNGRASGHTQNYIKAYFPFQNNHTGMFVNVQITEVMGREVSGVVV